MIHYDRLTRSGYLTNTPSFFELGNCSACARALHVMCICLMEGASTSINPSQQIKSASFGRLQGCGSFILSTSHSVCSLGSCSSSPLVDLPSNHCFDHFHSATLLVFGSLLPSPPLPPSLAYRNLSFLPFLYIPETNPSFPPST